MNTLPLRSELVLDRSASADAAPIEIRHLVFDGCADHDLQANGVYNVARQIASEQAAAGQKVKIIFLREEERQVPKEGPGVPIVFLTLNGRKLLGRRISMTSEMLDAITAPSDKPLFFHIHSARQPMLVPVIFRLRKLGIPYAMTIHGRYAHLEDGGEGAKRRLSNLYLHHVERRILEGARFVQGVSRKECDLIRRIAPQARVEFVQNAAYSSHFEGTPPSERMAPTPDFPVFGFLGRYEIEHKGLDLLVGGFAAYRKAGGKGRLELVGTGPARDDAIALARELGVGQFVVAEGPRYGAEKARTFASWDYFVMASRFEGMPVGALEAALTGLPLIVSAETGLRGEVDQFHAGFAIGRLTAEAVAIALLQAEARAPRNGWPCRRRRAVWRCRMATGRTSRRTSFHSIAAEEGDADERASHPCGDGASRTAGAGGPCRR